MLNRKKILNAYNAHAEKSGCKKVRTNSELISAFLDLQGAGITDEMVLDAIERGLVNSREELLDADYIKKTVNYVEPSEPAVEPVSVPNNVKGTMGSFEAGIYSMVSAILNGCVDEKLAEIFKDYVIAHPQTQTVRLVHPVTGNQTNGIRHKVFDEVRIFLELKEKVLLVGPAGTGKSEICKQIADFLGIKYHVISMVSNEYQLTGYVDAYGVYHSTPFYEWATQGGMLILEEVDSYEANPLLVVNNAFSNREFVFPNGERVIIPEDACVVACANTWGLGASMEYVGRNQLDASTRNRFGYMVKVDYDPRIEEAQTDDNDLLDFARLFRKKCEEYGIHHITSYRNIRALSKAREYVGEKVALETALLQNLEPDDVSMMYNDFCDKVDAWSTAFCEFCTGR